MAITKPMSAPAPRREAAMNAFLMNIWLATSADGTQTELFINQNSAIDYQNSNTDATIIAGLGISTQNQNTETVTRVDAIGDSSYPVSGDQPPRSGLS